MSKKTKDQRIKDIAHDMAKYAMAQGIDFHDFREACFQLAGAHGAEIIVDKEKNNKDSVYIYNFEVTNDGHDFAGEYHLIFTRKPIEQEI